MKEQTSKSRSAVCSRLLLPSHQSQAQLELEIMVTSSEPTLEQVAGPYDLRSAQTTPIARTICGVHVEDCI
eukprot:scaffold14632_cov22-Cyclotella_meneghiniana.AAC.3